MARRILRLSAMRVALAWASVVSLALCASPLTGVHGVESALFLGLTLPIVVAPLGVALVGSLRSEGSPRPIALDLLGQAFLAATLVVSVPVIVLALDQLRFRQCTPLEGLAFMLLGPLAGCLLAGVVGLLIGATIRRRRLAYALAALVPVTSALLGLYSFWSTPAIFVFDHFAGVFPGTLYDEDVALNATFVSFRIVSLGLGFALSALFFAGWAPDEASFHWRALARHPLASALSLLGFVAVAGAHLQGPALEHRSTAESIAELLGGRAEGARCVVHYPREMDGPAVARLVEDCDLRVSMAESALGVRQEAMLQLFLYRSADERRRAMGASGTNIAKPWRNEVHLQRRAWPHPILFHEVVHVVAGNGAPQPFRVAMSHGLIPNPGLIEGLAVAVAWDVKHDLTPHQWARAMRELGLLPPLDSLMGVGFLQRASGRAYIASGSFIRYLLDTRGAEYVMSAYSRGQIDGEGGPSMLDLESEWHAHLDGLEISDDTIAIAEMRFSQPSIFSRICPHRVAALRRTLAGDLAAGDPARILETCDELLEIDDADLGARMARMGALEARGSSDEALRELDALEGAFQAPAPLLVTARMQLADAAWSGGRRDEAERTYRELLRMPQTDDAARQLEVRLLGLESGGEVSERIRALLVRGGQAAVTPAIAIYLGERIGALRADGLGPYLVGRQLHGQRRFELALEAMLAAAERGLPTRRLTVENERLLVASLLAIKDLDVAEARLDALGPEEPLWAEDWRARIAFERAKEPPAQPEPAAQPQPPAQPEPLPEARP